MSEARDYAREVRRKAKIPEGLVLHGHLAQQCWYCGVPFLGKVECLKKTTPFRRRCPTVDHVIPTSRGGSKGTWNRVRACHGCNTRKGNMLLEEFRELEGGGLFWAEEFAPQLIRKADPYLYEPGQMSESVAGIARSFSIEILTDAEDELAESREQPERLLTLLNDSMRGIEANPHSRVDIGTEWLKHQRRLLEGAIRYICRLRTRLARARALAARSLPLESEDEAGVLTDLLRAQAERWESDAEDSLTPDEDAGDLALAARNLRSLMARLEKVEIPEEEKSDV